MKKMNHHPTKRVAAFLFVAVLSSQSLSTAFAANKADSSAIAPKEASYGFYVDNYKKNDKANMTPESNPSIGVLSKFLDLWTPGSSWDNGTKKNPKILDENISKVVSIRKNSTADQEKLAYLDDRRNQNYSMIDGLGPYTDAFIKKANAGTSIPDTIPEDAKEKLYDDKGNENSSWADESSSLGDMVKFVNMVRNASASTSSAKAYYSYMRPFRWLNDKSIVLSTLKPAIKPDEKADSDGGFPSGHTNAAYLAALSLAYSVPERFEEMLTRASELGNSRIVAGMHSPLDVMGGRVMSSSVFASVLNDSEYDAAKKAAYDQAHSELLNQPADSKDRFEDYAANKAAYTERLTYGFEQIGDTTKPMVVPKGAEALLETRLPYLDATQRRWVLYSTGLPSGYPVLDDEEGWGRLNLFAAANGYGAFDNDVILNMDASKGGFSALDSWKNDISGNGSLTKLGSGKLILSGSNSYTGGTFLNEGTLEATSASAFGNGDVKNYNGVIVENSDSLSIKGDFTQGKDGVLELNIKNADDLLNIDGNADLNGTLKLNFVDGYVPESNTEFLTYSSNKGNTSFSSIEINGLTDNAKLSVNENGISLVTETINDTDTNTDSDVNADVNVSDNNKNAVSPKTGDATNMFFYLILLTGSSVFIYFTISGFRKSSNR